MLESCIVLVYCLGFYFLFVRFFKCEMKHYFRFLKFVMRYYYCREMSTLELQGESNWRLVRSNWRMELEKLKIFR